MRANCKESWRERLHTSPFLENAYRFPCSHWPSFGRLLRCDMRLLNRYIALLLAPFVVARVQAQRHPLLDNGSDPDNIGRGDWIYKLDKATNQLDGVAPN